MTVTDDIEPSQEGIGDPILDLMKGIPGSPVSTVIRLMIAEGRKHPDLVEWYWEHVASRGMTMIRDLLDPIWKLMIQQL